MIPEHLLPVPLLTRQQKQPVPIVAPAAPAWHRFPLQILRLLVWLFQLRGRQMLRRPVDEAFADRLRAMFDEMGGFWVKIGQLISLRNDVLPPALCKQLALLQYQAVGFPFEVARAVIEAELGRPLDEVFDMFDQQPIAAASIAQIHRARLRESQAVVAVKVARPDIARNFGRDMKMFRLMAALFSRVPALAHLGWDQMYWEMQQIFLEEVDYRYEAANMRKLGKTLRRHNVFIPEVSYQHSGRSILVMEWVAGVLMSDFLSVGRSDPARLRRWMAQNNVDPVLVGERLFLTFFRQLFEDNMFHADMHPGNIIILRDSQIALIDLGSVGSLDAQFLTNYQQMMRACSDRDFARAVDYLFLLTDRWPANVDQVKARVTRSFQDWAERAGIKSLPYAQRSMWSIGMETGQLLALDNVVLSWQFMKINRTWSTLDGSLSFLIPEADYIRLIDRYFKGARRRFARSLSRIDRDDLATLVQGAAGLATLGENLLQQETRVFQGSISAAAGFFAIGFRAFSGLMLAGGLLASYVLLSRYRQPLALPAALRPPSLEELAAALPPYTVYHWSVLALAGFVLYRTFWQLSQRMAEKRPVQ